MPLSAGTRLGPYEILSPSEPADGRGLPGARHEARSGRRDQGASDRVRQRRGRARALRARGESRRGALAPEHPRGPRLRPLGETTYAVMELLEGESLRERLADGPLPPRKAVEIAREVALGLAAAHEKGIVHRDLKPENLFLTKDGRVKILDFGLARQIALPAAGDTHSPTAAQISQPGAVLGTVGYMAPEQLRGHPADQRSDIFSLGAVLYEVLSGRRAFTGDTAIETMNAILKDDPPELSRPDRPIPAGLERTVSHCLEKKPEERFQSARDLAFGLSSLSSAAPESGAVRALPKASMWRSTPGHRGRGGRRAGARVSLGRAHRVAGTPRRRSRSGDSRSDGATFSRPGSPPTERRSSTARPGRGSPPSSSRSARTRSNRGRSGSSTRTWFLFPRKESWPSSASIGSYQAPETVATLARVPLGGGAPRDIAENVLSASWTPDGGDLAVIRLTPDGDGRIEWPIGHVVFESFLLSWDLAISPDGARLAFAEFSSGPGLTIWTMDRQGKKTTAAAGLTSFGHLAWSKRTGNLLFLGGRGNGDLGLRSRLPFGSRARPLASAAGLQSARCRVRRTPSPRALQRRGASVIWMPPGGTRQIELGWLDDIRAGEDLNRRTHRLQRDRRRRRPERRRLHPSHGRIGPAIRLGDGDRDGSFTGRKVGADARRRHRRPDWSSCPTGAGPPRSRSDPRARIRSSPSFSRGRTGRRRHQLTAREGLRAVLPRRHRRARAAAAAGHAGHELATRTARSPRTGPSSCTRRPTAGS